MSIFYVETTAVSPIREYWKVEAETAEEAAEIYGQRGECLYDEVLGEEEDRQVETVHPEADLAKFFVSERARKEAPAMLELLQSVEDDWGELFDSDEPMNGGDCCEWLCQFIERAREVRARIATPGG